jgi:hypothetical protein
MSAELMTERAGDDSTARSALARTVEGRPDVSLEQVLSVAQLTTRVELKYLVPLESLPTLLDRLPHELAALDIDGRRAFSYESVYFDTEDFALYHHHVQGRRKRYKIRIRSYPDTGDAMFEVKLKGLRGQTVKERLPYDYERRAELTGEGRAFLDSVIADAYGIAVPTLRSALTTAYGRVTLVDLQRQSRLTIDVNLSWSDRERSQRADHVALIETKSLSGPRPVDALLCSIGFRPVRISKYCLGVALLHPEKAANRWNRILSRQLGWQRTASNDPVSSAHEPVVGTGGPAHRRTAAVSDR